MIRLAIYFFLAGRLVAAEPLGFNEHIRPILAGKCFACHGPDEAGRDGDFRLDVREEALSVLTPGKPMASELLRRVASDDPDEVMPPPDAKIGRLSSEDVAKLKRWIDEGAAYERHWAFVPVPKNDGDADLIDAPIAKLLQANGHAQQPEADRRTLLRRVSLDLTGLPPSFAELQAYLSDDSPEAYERAVDRLLASPHYGA